MTRLNDTGRQTLIAVAIILIVYGLFKALGL